MASHPNSGKLSRLPAVLFLLWNLIGVAFFTLQSNTDLAELARSDPYQAKLWAAMPRWAWFSYGVAVGAGTASAVGLVLRRRSAVWFAIVGLIGIVVQFSYAFLQTDLLEVRGAGAAIFPVVIFLIALAQLAYAAGLKRRGLLR